MIYDDIYYLPVAIAEYNARSPKFRVRTRREIGCQVEDRSWIRTAQIVYTRAVEHPTDDDEQFRFFPTRKDKFYLILPKDVNHDKVFPGITQSDKHWETLSSILEGDVDNWVTKQVQFIRRVAKHPRKIYVSVDSVNHEGIKFHVVEIKAYLDRKHLLKEAMRFVMTRFNVLQTTRSKIDLLSNRIIPEDQI